MDQCPECGFDYRPERAPEAAATIRRGAADLAAALTAGVDPARRRSPQQWSPLEYACHVRDVLLVQRERVLLARRVDRPVLTTMGRDERVAHDG